MEEKNYEAIIEAILFTIGESVELEKIAEAIELDKKKTKAIIHRNSYHRAGWFLPDVHEDGDV